MTLRIPTTEELRKIYEEDLVEAFPPAELKPLEVIIERWQAGLYRPYCLYDDDGAGPIGTAFLWMGRPGWALLDYLCVTAGWRNDGFGSEMLKLLEAVEPETVIFAESEAPCHAPDPAMAQRRLGFYQRNGGRLAGFDAHVFGVHYKLLYFADREVEDTEFMREYEFVYRQTFTPEKYAKHIQIPYTDQEKEVRV